MKCRMHKRTEALMGRSTAILVVGMHRTGTSAVARTINLLGADIGTCLLPAVHGDNARGYWEQQDIVRLNDECLQHFGGSWNDPRPLPWEWLQDDWLRDWKNRASNVLREQFEGQDLIVIKDPRLARLLPLWLDTLKQSNFDPKVLITLRHPSEVAASLRHRSENQLDVTAAHQLWLRYLVELATCSRDVPRAWVRYDHLLANWRTELAALDQVLGIKWPVSIKHAAAEIDAFLDRDLQHQRAGQEVIDLENPAVAATCRAYREILECLDSGKNPDRVINWAEQALKHQIENAGKSLQDNGTEPTRPVGPTESAAAGANIAMPSELLRLRCRLYYRTKDGSYTPECSVPVEAELDGNQLIALFVLPENVSLDLIRFDPAEIPGIYRLNSIKIDGQTVRLSEESILAVKERKLPRRQGELARIACSDSDPWIEINLQTLPGLPAEIRELAVHFQRESLSQLVGEHIDLMGTEVHAAQRELADQLNRLHAQSAQAVQLAQSAQSVAYMNYLAQSGVDTLPQRGKALDSISASNGHLRLIAELPGQNAGIWGVHGDDPVFHLNLSTLHSPIKPGWYLLSVTLQAVTGELKNPRLYVDHGEGFRENDAISLALAKNAVQHRLLIRFERPVHALRLDPSNHPDPCDFMYVSPTLKRITRFEALLRLAVPAVKRMRSSGASWPRVCGEIAFSMRRGPALALENLHANTQVSDGIFAGISYIEWIAANDTLDNRQRDAICSEIAKMTHPVVISIILPVYNTPEQWLRSCINSVMNQLYPHWELCIADDASTDPEVKSVLQEFAARDKRIKVTYRSENGHISAASNSALELATGEYVALLDHDDELAEHALYHVARSLQQHPEARLLYSDEDKIDENGARFDPYFKPDWNPELFLRQNYISHLGVYLAAWVREVGGFRDGYEGAQDHDLALRISEQLQDHEIIHIPKVLYHWRATKGSTAKAPGEKDYAASRARRAVEDHLRRNTIPGTVTHTEAGYLRVKYSLPENPPRVSLIIPTRDRLDLLRMSVGSILANTSYPNFEIIIVDNQSQQPETIAWLKEIAAKDSRVKILSHDKPFNFSRINNDAVARASGEMVGLVNNDIEATDPDWLSEMVSHANRPDVGAVGAKLYYPDGSIQHAGVVLGFGGVAGHAYCGKPQDHAGQMGRAMLVQNMSAVTAACLVVRKAAYLEVGGMNEDLRVAFNDIDFCMRLLKAGYRNVWTPHAELIHHESASRGLEDTMEKQRRFASESQLMKSIWGDQLNRDPAYNANLSLSLEPFSLRRV